MRPLVTIMLQDSKIRHPWDYVWVASSALVGSKVPKVRKAYQVRVAQALVMAVLAPGRDIPGSQGPTLMKRIDHLVRQRVEYRSYHLRRSRHRSRTRRARPKVHSRRKNCAFRCGMPIGKFATPFIYREIDVILILIYFKNFKQILIYVNIIHTEYSVKTVTTRSEFFYRFFWKY